MKKIYLLLILAVASFMNAFAQNTTKIPFAILSDENTTLTFYYGTGEGFPASSLMSISFDGWRYREWNGSRATITTVAFDESFAEYTELTTTQDWFYGFEMLTTLVGLENLHTDNVDTMYRMFYGCKSLTKLNLATFNTAKVKATGQMFYDCITLKTIYVSDLWNMDKVEGSYQMFANCYELVGGQGTVWDRRNTEADRAHIDGGEDNPGYLTYADGTAIKALPSSDASARPSGPVYNLAGQRISKPASGLYITGGHKRLSK